MTLIDTAQYLHKVAVYINLGYNEASPVGNATDFNAMGDYFMSFRFVVLASILLVALAACAGISTRAQDAKPLSDEVPIQTENSGQPAQPAEAAVPTSAQEKVAINLDATAVAFKIEGGIVGFCDELVIQANGNYTLNTCTQEPVSGTLPQSDRLSLKAWLENLNSFQLRTDDNPGGADNLSTELSFAGQGQTEADDPQKQVIYDWVSGLVVQLRPKPQPEPTPTLDAAVTEQGLCPEIARPALMLVDFEAPAVVELMDVSSQASCQVALSQPPFGRLASAAGNLYYLVADSDAKTVTVWEKDASGAEKPLDFTAMVMEEPSPHGFTVSDDGSKIAWAQTVIDLEADPPIYKNYLWLANIDGSGLVTVLDGEENTEIRYAYPVRFSTADNSLFYALQPDIGGPVFNGRYDTLYRVPAGGGESSPVYACPVEENPVCITGLAQDGRVFTTLDPATDSIQVFGGDGQVISSIPLPATDYVERTAFSPNGSLAFVSATLSQPESEEEPPLPNPGYITVLAAPYTDQAQTLLSDNSVGTLWGWLDNSQLVYGSLNAQGQPDTSVVNLEGQVKEVSQKFAVGVLQQ